MAGFGLIASVYTMFLLQLFPLMVHMRMTSGHLIVGAFKLIFFKAHLSLLNVALVYLLWVMGQFFPWTIIFLSPGIAATLSYVIFDRKVQSLIVLDSDSGTTRKRVEGGR